GMMAYFVKNALVDRQIPAHLETEVTELIRDDDGAVIGVRAIQRGKGGKDFLVKANRGVIVATGGYHRQPTLPKDHQQLPHWNSMCQPSVAGDGYVMGSEVGAQIAAVPPNNLGLFFGYLIPGEEHEGKPLWRGSWDGGCPHALWVNQA